MSRYMRALDAPTLTELLAQILSDELLHSVRFHGASDALAGYEAISCWQAAVIIPTFKTPNLGSTTWPEHRSRTRSCAPFASLAMRSGKSEAVTEDGALQAIRRMSDGAGLRSRGGVQVRLHLREQRILGFVAGERGTGTHRNADDERQVDFHDGGDFVQLHGASSFGHDACAN